LAQSELAALPGKVAVAAAKAGILGIFLVFKTFSL
jgi:hypothetical protein